MTRSLRAAEVCADGFCRIDGKLGVADGTATR
jgi:hypothetical protein